MKSSVPKRNGKGSRPRPLSISLDEYKSRWEETFGKKGKKDENKKRICK